MAKIMQRNPRELVITVLYGLVYVNWLTTFVGNFYADWGTARQLNGMVIAVFFGFSLVSAISNPATRYFALVLDSLEISLLAVAVSAAGYPAVSDVISHFVSPRTDVVFAIVGCLIPIQMFGRLLEDFKETTGHQCARVCAVTICLTAGLCHPLTYGVQAALSGSLMVCVLYYVLRDKWSL